MRMVQWSRPLVGVALVGVMGLGLGERVAAQDATPVTDGSGVACTVEPRAVDELLQIWFDPAGTPIPATDMPTPVDTASDVPAGTPADDETATALTATMREVFACFDAGNVPGALALMSENAIRQFGPDFSDEAQDSVDEVRAIIEAQIAAAATPIPAGMTTVTVVSEAWDARTFDDGRAGAFFESEGDTVFAYFVQEDGTWLLDEFVDVLDDATPTAG